MEEKKQEKKENEMEERHDGANISERGIGRETEEEGGNDVHREKDGNGAEE